MTRFTGHADIIVVCVVCREQLHSVRCKRPKRCATARRTFMAPLFVLFQALEEPLVALAGEDTASQAAHTTCQRLLHSCRTELWHSVAPPQVAPCRMRSLPVRYDLDIVSFGDHSLPFHLSRSTHVSCFWQQASTGSHGSTCGVVDTGGLVAPACSGTPQRGDLSATS